MPAVRPEDLAEAAAVVVQTALRVQERENFLIVSDADSDDIGHALKAAGEAVGGNVTLARLDLVRSISTNHTGDRPHKVLPDAVRRPLQGAQVAAFVASPLAKELSMREQMMHIVSECGVRFAHMPGISQEAFALGNRFPYDEVAASGRSLLQRLEFTKTLETTSAAGTHLRITLREPLRWIDRLGEIQPGKSAILPAGALYTTPESVSGTFVANASIGEFFGARAGVLLGAPVRFTIEAGRVTEVHAQTAANLQKDIRGMLAFAPNSDRVGLVAIGVNVGLRVPTGDAVVDQNLCGLHLLIGDPNAKESGATWSARSSFAACQAESSVFFDGKLAVEGGRVVSGTGG